MWDWGVWVFPHVNDREVGLSFFNKNMKLVFPPHFKTLEITLRPWLKGQTEAWGVED